MTLGLNRGCVELVSHQEEWHTLAQVTITLIAKLLDDVAVNIEHVGSTAIRGISAKPIIDIAVGVKKLENILPCVEKLEENGIVFRGEDVNNQYLFVIGNFENDTRTHHIHVVEHNSDAWKNYINFRDYLNDQPAQAKEYEELKQELAQLYPEDRVAYTKGKQKFIDEILALAESFYEEQI